MGRIKKYFQKEFSKEMFCLNHDSASDFYLSAWQKNRSPIPLLIIRTIIFVGTASTLIASMVIMTRSLNFGSWFIFLTHWGLILNMVNSIFALIISLKVSCRGFIDGSFSLPWYVKTYWVFYNVSIPLAFFITIFYFALLTEFSDTYGMDPVLDLFVHLVNSLLMLTLVVASKHPTRLLHFYWSLCLGIIYMIFTIIFHFSGAKSPFGTSWIYPMVDWSKPGIAIAVVIGSAVGLIIMHIILVAITLLRDALTRGCRGASSLSISDERYY